MRLLLLGLVLLFAVPPADAQRRHSQPFAERGDIALLVGIEGVQVTSLRPVLNGVGLRYRIADQTVLGTSVGYSSQSSDDEQEQQYDPSPFLDYTSSTESKRVDGSLWFEQHLGRRRRSVSPFVGAALTIGHETADRLDLVEQNVQCQPDTSFSCGVDSRLTERELTTHSLGGSLFVGAEVRIVSGVTVGGAYSLGVIYSETESRELERRSRFGDVEEQERHTNRNAIQVGTQASQLYLSVYF